MKKVLVIFLFVVAIFTMSCRNDSQSKCFQYVFDGENAIVSGFTPIPGIDSTNIVIPERVKHDGHTYKVTKIEDGAFENCNYITSMTLPETIIKIGNYAFRGCKGLTSVTIPNSVTSIGDEAFAGCKSLPVDNHLRYADTYLVEAVNRTLSTYAIKEGTIFIGRSAFENCSGLTSIEIPNSVTSIGDNAFYKCSGLTSITIPNSVTSIGERAFRDCSGLTSITIPNSVTNIGKGAFSLCYGLTSITIPNSVTCIGEFAFNDCDGLMSITIPNSVTCIGDYAFFGCTGLTSVTIPNSVTNIGKGAFFMVPNIVYSGEATGSPWDARSVNGYVDVFLVYSDDTKKNLLACSAAATGTIEIPNSVTCIGEFAFNDCDGLMSITIPNSVTCIGDYAFYKCSGLTSVTIPNSVTSIGYHAFDGCTGLTSVTIPNNVTSIEAYAYNQVPNIVYSGEATGSPWDARSVNGYVEGFLVFSDDTKTNLLACSAVATGTIEIPNSVTCIGKGAFFGCIGLTSVTIPNSVTSIGEGAFENCSGLTSIEIPNSVTCIGDYAFYKCSGLTSVTIPNSVTCIGKGAFFGCTGLTSITIPNSVTSIGEVAFCMVPNIVYSGEATGSPWDARSVNGYVEGFLVFSDDTKTNLLVCFAAATGTIEIPNGVTSIGNGAFRYCIGLTSVTIPNSVTSIGGTAFDGCKNLNIKLPRRFQGEVDLKYCKSVMYY